MGDYLVRVQGGYKLMKDIGGGAHAEQVVALMVDAAGNVIATLPVSGPLTDAQLRAADVKVSLDGEAVAVTAAGGVFTATPAVTAGAYSAGDAVGELIELANAARSTGGGGWITNITVLDDAGQDAELEFWFFDSAPTDVADNAAWAPAEADLHKLIGVISSLDGSWYAAGTPSALNIAVAHRFNAVATSLFLKIVTRGTPTYAATDDVTVRVAIAQD